MQLLSKNLSELRTGVTKYTAEEISGMANQMEGISKTNPQLFEKIFLFACKKVTADAFTHTEIVALMEVEFLLFGAAQGPTINPPIGDIMIAIVEKASKETLASNGERVTPRGYTFITGIKREGDLQVYSPTAEFLDAIQTQLVTEGFLTADGKATEKSSIEDVALKAYWVMTQRMSSPAT